MVDVPSAYPLAWPPNRPRTAVHYRSSGPFSTKGRNGPNDFGTKLLTLAEARQRLARELDRLNARSPVLSSNLELRVDGTPRGDRAAPADPGVALYFELNRRPTVLSCDSFNSVAQNIAALAATIDAMRRIERYGAVTTDQVFTGFLALPAPMVVDDWREALGNPATLAEAEASFRERMKRAYPNGIQGSEARARELNAAIARAREVLK